MGALLGARGLPFAVMVVVAVVALATPLVQGAVLKPPTEETPRGGVPAPQPQEVANGTAVGSGIMCHAYFQQSCSIPRAPTRYFLTYGDCCTFCLNTPRCISWTFRPNTNGYWGTCWYSEYGCKLWPDPGYIAGYYRGAEVAAPHAESIQAKAP
eukprot:RCo038964